MTKQKTNVARFDYSAAAYPDQWQILGVTLRPFSLGHYLKLRRLGSPFVSTNSENAGIGDLLLAVIVCSMRSHPDPEQDPFWQWLTQPRPDKLADRLRLAAANKLLAARGQAPMSPADLDIVRWGKRVGQFDLSEKSALFTDYLKTHTAQPGFWEKQSESPEPAGGHWSQSLLSVLVSKGGYSQEEALNAPLSKAFADFFKLCEMEGCGRQMTEEEEEIARV